ncbi:phage tail tube protein [Fontivita pretiosa]|uniref:phage tail tube protein n=1 Tax=Fontivita pretiosa TaxID=2989684 RepID=UPI003D17C883
MSVKLGLDAKLYFCVAGIGGTPTWTLLGNVKNVTLNLQKGEADVTTRANQGWRATAGTLKEGTIEFEMVWDTADAGFTAIQQAYFNNTLIGLAAMDGDITTNGSQGLWADCSIIDFSRDEPLEDAISVKVTAKPTYSANAPIWKTIAP